MEDYKRMSKSHQKDVYRHCDEKYGSTRPATGSVTSKEYDNLKFQIIPLSKKVDDSLMIE